MSPLTDKERDLLKVIKNGRVVTGCACTEDWAQALADHVRCKVPEVDDTTLARVVLAVANHVTSLTFAHGLRTSLHAGSVLAEAAAELAALELEHPC